ncbi:MAG: hypothetical protein RL637_926 [Pseudomonadota bacterium]|jgi:AcrR family transcriptional regulator
MGRRSEHATQKIKEIILKAAETIVIEDGFSALKARELAMEMGYTIGIIYTNFENMNDIAIQIKSRTIQQFLQECQQINMLSFPEQQLLILAQTYATFAQQNFNRWRMVFEYCQQSKLVIPQECDAGVMQLINTLSELFEQLIQTHQPYSSQQAARNFCCSIHGICLIYINQKNLSAETIQTLNQQLYYFVQQFIQGWKSFSYKTK